MEGPALLEFLLAIVAFLIAHAVPPAPPVRERLVRWLGRRTYLFLYSAVSLALIVWVIVAARRAPYLPLWDAASWQAMVPLVLMPLATWLLIAGLLEPNAISISVRSVDSACEPGPVAMVTRHPVLVGFLLWAVSHIPANGDVVALILFGGMALLSLGGIAILDRRNRRRLGNARWQAVAARTSIVPFMAIAAGRASFRVSANMIWAAAAAAILYLWFVLDGHQRFIGPDPLAWL